MDAVSKEGKFMQAGIDRVNVGVRPIITVDISKLPCTQGTGSYDDPYR